MCYKLHKLYTWLIVYGTLGLMNVTLGVQKDKLSTKIQKIELNCVSGWQSSPLRIKMMNGLVHDD